MMTFQELKKKSKVEFTDTPIDKSYEAKRNCICVLCFIQSWECSIYCYIFCLIIISNSYFDCKQIAISFVLLDVIGG